VPKKLNGRRKRNKAEQRVFPPLDYVGIVLVRVYWLDEVADESTGVVVGAIVSAGMSVVADADVEAPSTGAGVSE
jgi:hypothetical protein